MWSLGTTLVALLSSLLAVGSSLCSIFDVGFECKAHAVMRHSFGAFPSVHVVNPLLPRNMDEHCSFSTLKLRDFTWQLLGDFDISVKLLR
jgi:hypothetical protein